MSLEIKNEELFKRVVSSAISNAKICCKNPKQSLRWERAVLRAEKEIIENPYLHYDSEDKNLIILSSSSNRIYAANGVCQCFAYSKGKPCWHRAAARIWRLYLKAECAAAPAPATATSDKTGEINSIEKSFVFLRTTVTTRREKIGNVWI